MECQHCGQMLKSLSSLKQHQKTAKYCLLKQNKESPEEYACIACSAMFTLKSSLHKHLQICKENTPEKEIIRQYESRQKQLVFSYEEKLREKDMTIKEVKASNRKLKAMEKRNSKKLEKAGLTNKQFGNEITNTLNNFFGFGGRK